MLFWCYTLGLVLWSLLCSPLILAALLLVPKFRAGFWQKWGCYPAPLQAVLAHQAALRPVWIHCVSVGEFNAARPLIDQLHQAEYPVVLSTTTATGNRVARQVYPDVPVLFFPFDFPGAVASAFRQIQPRALVILETEIWPNVLHIAQKQAIPVMMVNGRLSDRSFSNYTAARGFFGPVVQLFSLLLMQSETDRDRMIALGTSPEQVVAVGNLKFEGGGGPDPIQVETLRHQFGWETQAPVVVFASTHPGEEEQCLTVAQALWSKIPALKVILAPRHPERAEAVARLLARQNIPFVQRSQLSQSGFHREQAPVILLDTMGELMNVYALATVAVIGGSLVARGGHNPLEPIQAGAPVVFGPHMSNFRDITQQILAARAGIQVPHRHALQETLLMLLQNPQQRLALVQWGQLLLSRNRGVTQQVLQHLRPWLVLPTTTSDVRE